jgi:general nucleoside transport system permease protein
MAAATEVLRRLATPRRLRGIASSLLAVVLALLVSMGIIAAFGDPPLAAIQNLWIGAFGSSQQIGGTLSYLTPLVIVALGWILVASVGRISVGFDGQILVGGILATTVGVNLAGLPTALHLPLGILAAIAGGAVWAGIAAWLWAARRVNEIIATLLLNFVAAKIVAWLVRGPLQEPSGGFPQSSPLTPSARWPDLVPNTPLAGDIFVALLLVAAMPLLLRSTGFGYRLRLTGANDEAARHAGVNTRRITVAALVISGALSGLAGSSLILAGQTGVMSDGFNQNLGFYGIVVALLARNSPVGTLPAALLVGALLQGGPFMQAQVGISSALVSLVQGLVVVFVAGSVFLNRGRAARRDAGVGAPATVDEPRPVEVP